jgi:hypothetical protein
MEATGTPFPWRDIVHKNGCGVYSSCKHDWLYDPTPISIEWARDCAYAIPSLYEEVDKVHSYWHAD